MVWNKIPKFRKNFLKVFFLCFLSVINILFNSYICSETKEKRRTDLEKELLTSKNIKTKTTPVKQNINNDKVNTIQNKEENIKNSQDNSIQTTKKLTIPYKDHQEQNSAMHNKHTAQTTQNTSSQKVSTQESEINNRIVVNNKSNLNTQNKTTQSHNTLKRQENNTNNLKQQINKQISHNRNSSNLRQSQPLKSQNNNLTNNKNLIRQNIKRPLTNNQRANYVRNSNLGTGSMVKKPLLNKTESSLKLGNKNEIEKYKINPQTEKIIPEEKVEEIPKDYKISITDKAYNISKEKNTMEKKDFLTFLLLILTDLKNYYGKGSKNFSLEFFCHINEINYKLFNEINVFPEKINVQGKIKHSNFIQSIADDMNKTVGTKLTNNSNSPSWIKALKSCIKNKLKDPNSKWTPEERNLYKQFIEVLKSNFKYLEEEIIIDKMQELLSEKNKINEAIINEINEKESQTNPLLEKNVKVKNKNKSLKNNIGRVRDKKEQLSLEIIKNYGDKINGILKNRLLKIPVIIIRVYNSCDAIMIPNTLKKSINLPCILNNFNEYPLKKLQKKINGLFQGKNVNKSFTMNTIFMDAEQIEAMAFNSFNYKNVWSYYKDFLNDDKSSDSLLCVVKNNLSNEWQEVSIEKVNYGEYSNYEKWYNNVNSNEANNSNFTHGYTIYFEIYIFPKVQYSVELYDHKKLVYQNKLITFLQKNEYNININFWKSIQKSFIANQIQELLNELVYKNQFIITELVGKKETVTVLNNGHLLTYLEIKNKTNNTTYTMSLNNLFNELEGEL